MFANKSWKEATSSRSVLHFSRISINVFLLFALIVTSCVPAQKTTPAVPKTDGSAGFVRQLAGPDSDYIPPVYDRPEPRTAVRTHLDAQESSDHIAAPFAENYDRSMPEAYIQALQQAESFTPPPNPVRAVKPSRKSVSVNGVFTVTTLADKDDGVCDSDCSYREAIYAANDEPGPNTVTFSVSSRLQIDGPLPYSTDPAGLTIDGSGQKVTFGGKPAGGVSYAPSRITASSSPLAAATSACPPAASTLTLSGVTLSGCRVYVSYRLTVINSTFLSDSWITMGMVNENAAVSLTDVTFIDSGIFCSSLGCSTSFYGSNTFTRSYGSFLETSITGTVNWDHGGFTTGPMTISDGTLDILNIWVGLSHIDNLDTGTLNAVNILFYGGGDIANAGTLNIGNSLHIRTSINNTNNGMLQIKNSTLLGSSVSNSNTANLHLYNTILAQGSDCLGMATAGQYNLIESSSHACGLTNGVGGNIIGSDAQLDKGQITTGDGFTYYYIPNAGSPVIDAGNDSVCAAAPINNTSYNGVPRPQGRHCDIGAVEAEPAVDDRAIISSCPVDKCISAAGGTYKPEGKPINTRTGGYDYNIVDISIPTSASALTFTRDYASQSLSQPTALSPGWTHNHATRLILPDDPGGEEETILFKLHSGNLFAFYENLDGTYRASPGLMASLVRQAGPPVRFLLTDARQNSYTFDEDGVLLSYEDPQGNTWEYTYVDGKLTQVSADGGSRYLSLQYDAQGRIEQVSDQTGRSVTYHYDPTTGDLDSVVDVTGQTWTYQYSNHLMTRVAAPGNVTVERTEYYPDGRAWKQFDGEDNLLLELTYNADDTTTVTDAFGKTQTLTYDVRGTMTSDSNQLGETTGKAYDYNFRPKKITNANEHSTLLTWGNNGNNLTNVVDAAGNQIRIDYDALNNPTSVVDPLNHLTTFEYDGKLLTSSIDALNGETTYTYTPEGFLASVTDPLGNTTSFTYDSHGQRTSMRDSQGNTWEYTYDSLGRLVDTTDPLGRVQHSEYDNAGRLIRTTQNYDPNRVRNAENQYNIVTEYGYDARGDLVSVTDTYGRTTQYAYDDAGQLVQVTDADGNITTNTYNEAGQLITTTDALGHATHYEYDAVGRQISVTDALGNTTYTAYNPDGTIASTTDALGRVTRYAYDNLQRLTDVTDPSGGVTHNEYDANGNLTATTAPGDQVVRYEYDALGRLIRQRDALNGLTENFYDAGGQLIQTVDARGNAVTYAYEANRLVSITNAAGNVTRYEYDDLGRRTAVVDAESGRTVYSYDALDRVVRVTDPLGHSTSTEYDALGQVRARTDANGNTTTFAYDDLGRLVSQTDPMGSVTSYTYDAVGSQLNVTDANNHTSTTEYDALNRPVTITDPLGNVTRITYDAGGQVVAAADALGNQTTFAYNPRGQQVSVTDSLGNVTSYGYDAAGSMTAMTDAKGIVTAYEYDALGRLTAVIENYSTPQLPDYETNVRTAYTYDANGNRLTIKDANGHISNFTYDELNRLVSESDALGNTWAYEYDRLGNQIAMIDANGQFTQYVYDDAGELTNVDYPGSDIDVSFAYDAGGRRTSMVDGMGTTAWTYDDLNRPTAITDPFNQTVRYAYDPAGNRTSLTYPDGKTVAYSYDAGDRLSRVTSDQSSVISYQYDPVGRLLAVLRPNGVDSTYTYDAGGRLTALQHATNEKTLSSFDYSYDAVGNRTQAIEMVRESPADPTVTVLVASSKGTLLAGKPVYVFNGDTYTGYSKITDANGEATLTLPGGSYRFRVDVDGTQFWSEPRNHCDIPDCADVVMTIPEPVLVTVKDTDGTPMADLNVYAFDGSTYSGFHGKTNENGQVSLRLPHGNYRFRADLNGTQFWSGENNHCTVVVCTMASVTVTLGVTVSVADTGGAPKAGLKVYAFNGATYTGYNGTTNESGQVTFTLPQGSYRFRADFNGTQFWSGVDNHCDLPGCRSAGITVTNGVLVTVLDTDGTPKAGLNVYAFNGSTYTGYSKTTDADGQAVFTLPVGSYRFRADLNGTQFWSGASNHCDIPGCGSASVTVSKPMTVTVLDTDGAPKAGLNVYAFNGSTYTGYSKTTNTDGQAVFTLPLGSYRFRADLNGTQFWSGAANHCDLPGCGSASVTVSKPVTVTVLDTDGAPKAGLNVYAFNGSTYTGYSKTTNTDGQAVFTLPLGSYRFRADLNGTQFWSGASNHCDIPGCGSAQVTVTIPVTVTIQDAGGAPKAGVNVYAFNGSTYTGYSKVSDANGQAVFTLPAGSYRFRADYSGTQYWSDSANHCTLPGCLTVSVTVGPAMTATVAPTATETPAPTASATLSASLTPTPSTPETSTPESGYQPSSHYARAQQASFEYQTTNDVTVTVLDTNGAPKEGLNIYAFDGVNYTGHHGATNASGQVTLTLPEGSYRFRADLNGTQFWSGTENHCTVPGCSTAGITVTLPITVTVRDTDGAPKEGLNVYAFDGATYTGYNKITNESGQAVFTLPLGSYHFRADLNGTQFWSGESNHCTIPSCQSAELTVTKPVTVRVADWDEQPYADLHVYAFDGATYTGYNGTTDANGNVTLTLPQGSYHFRADYDGVQFWSNPDENDCTVPGCTSAQVYIPGWGEWTTTRTIEYTYDPLYRLTSATSSGDDPYLYTYDAVGNRLTEKHGLATTYQYDAANRLTRVNSIPIPWDANGNMLKGSSNGITYSYDAANRLVSMQESGVTTTYAYNGLGDRLRQTVHGATTLYTLDLNAGLTQVLDDGTYSYTYGVDRISQQRGNKVDYFLGDALGSVRQLADRNGNITLAMDYDPYGAGRSEQTHYGFAGEYTDASGLVYLRARYYAPQMGRFLTRDMWEGDANTPASLNRFNYAHSNPVMNTDPSGQCIFAGVDTIACALIGAGIGFATGAAIGGAFGAMTYNWALAGECGCEMQQAAIQAGSIWAFAGSLALSGGLIGGVAGALAVLAPIGMIVVGGLGIVLSGWDIVKTVNIIKNELGRLTWCTAMRLMVDIAMIALSVVGIAKGIQGWRASGSLLKWRPNPIVPPSYKPIPDEAFVRFDPAKADASIDGSGLRTRFSNGRIWLTKFKYVKNIAQPEDLETILYRKDLWSLVVGKFKDGATLRWVKINSATPAGVTNKTNGIPQWFVTDDIPPSLLETVGRLLP